MPVSRASGAPYATDKQIRLRLWYHFTIRPPSSAVPCSGSAHGRHVDELPRARHLAHRDLDHRRPIALGKATAERRTERFGRAHPFGSRPEALRIAHEIRIGQVARDQPIAVPLRLNPAHVPEGIV